MSATNLLDIAARTGGQIAAAAADVLSHVTYELALEERFDHPAWRVRSVEIVEELSASYFASVQLDNDNPTTDERELRGSSATLIMQRAGASPRRFSGIVQTVVSEGTTPNGVRRCRLGIVPAFQCLDETVDWRKFLNMTVPDILRAVLAQGLSPFGREAQLNLTREGGGSPHPFPLREYTAQRGESVYQFVRRLCSEEGLALWYDQSGTAEKLVITDDNTRFARLQAPVRLLPPLGGGSARAFEALRSFELASSRVPTAATVNRFDLTRPMVPMLERADQQPTAPAAGPAGNGEIYDPTGAITLHQYQEDRYTGQDARQQARLRLEAAQVGAEVGSGEGDVIAFQPGAAFELTTGSGFPSPLEGLHLITRVRHVGQAALRGGTEAQGAASYVNTFTSMPAAIPFRPARIPRPVATFDYAVVASAAEGESIHHDTHGRVKVKFWWDRTPGPPTDNDSPWIPVTMPWAGQGRGFQSVPRQGDVVVVSYDLGDPDRPVVTSSVNTGTNRMMYPLASNTMTSWRTQSQRPDGAGGYNTPNYNEMSMDDAAGAERFCVHAGHDYHRTVLNDEYTNISNNESRTVGCDRDTDICGNEDLDIYGNRSVSVGGSDSVSVGGSRSLSVGGSNSVSVGGSETISVGGSETVTVTGPRMTTIVGPDTVILTSRGTNVSGSDVTHVTGTSELTADGAAIIKQGGTKVELKAGHVAIDAASWIHLKHGASEIVIDGGGSISIHSDAKVKIHADGNMLLDAPKITLSGHSEVSMAVAGNEVKVDSSGVTIKGAQINGTADGDCHFNGGSVKMN